MTANPTPGASCLHENPRPREAPGMDARYWVCMECGWRTELFSKQMVAQMRLHPLDVATWGPRV
jgi:hypothetical protein